MRLVEREAELERLMTLIPPSGRVALIEGPPGAGKTALMREACARSRMRVMQARCAADDPPFAAVRELFSPVDAGELEGTAALAAPALGLGSDEVDPFAAAHGLFWLLAGRADLQPIVLAIDDAPWLDTASLAFVTHLIPRVEDLPVAVVMTARAGDLRPDRPLAAALGTRPDLVRVVPPPLSATGTAHLVGAEHAEEIQQATAGNPLLVQTVRTALEAGEDVHEVLAGGVSVGRVILPRIHRIGRSAVAYAEALTVLGDGAAAHDVLAIGGDAAARDALIAAAVIDEDNRFLHPMIRGAVADAIPPGRLAELRAAAAEQLERSGAPAIEVARVAAATEPQGDPEAVRRLRAGAQESARAGALDDAVELLERALAEPPPPEERAALCRQAAQLGYEAGHPRTSEWAGLAIVEERDPVQQAWAAVEMGTILALQAGFRGEPAMAFALMERAAAADAEAGLILHAHTVMAFAMVQRTHKVIAPQLSAVTAQAGSDTLGQRLAAVVAAVEALCCGDIPRAVELCAMARTRSELPNERLTDQWSYWFCSATLDHAGAPDAASAMINAAVADARARGRRSSLRTALLHASASRLMRGDAAGAQADVQEAEELATAGGWAAGDPAVAASGIRAAIERDEAPELRDELWADAVTDTHFDAIMHCAVAELALRLGRPEEALAATQRARAVLPGPWRRPTAIYPWQPAESLALAALSRREEAAALADAGLQWARGTGSDRLLIQALRTVGGREALEEAVALGSVDATRERAWALYELGATLRRERRNADARQPLREALDIAVRGGLRLLARRARDELTAAGARPRREMLSGAEALTGRERRVAELAASGRSNREIAEELWLTRKTVESHLGSIYRKLDVGRAQLADELGLTG